MPVNGVRVLPFKQVCFANPAVSSPLIVRQSNPYIDPPLHSGDTNGETLSPPCTTATACD